MASLLRAIDFCTISFRGLLGSLGSASLVFSCSTLGKHYTNGVPNFTPVLVSKLVEAARFLVLAARSACGFLMPTITILVPTGAHMQPHRTSGPERESVMDLCVLLRPLHLALSRRFCVSGSLVYLRSVTLVSPRLIMGMPETIGELTSTPVLSLKLVDAARILVLAALSSFGFLK